MINGLLAILTSVQPQRDTLPRMDTAFVSAYRRYFTGCGRFIQKWNGEEAGAQTTASFLQQNGVFLKQYGVNGVASISRRGADPQQTQVMWNGLPVNHAMLGMADLNTMFLFGSKEVILTDGANATVFGSGSVGGTLQIHHGKSTDSGFSARSLSQTGSFGRYFQFFDASAGNGKNWIRAQAGTGYAANRFYYQDVVNNAWVRQQMQHAGSRYLQGRLMGGFSADKTSYQFVSEWGQAERNLGTMLGSGKQTGMQTDDNLKLAGEARSRFKKIAATQRLGYVQDRIRFEDMYSNTKDTSVSRVFHAQSEWYFNTGAWRWLAGADMQYQRGLSNAYGGNKTRIYPAQFISSMLTKNKTTASVSARFEWFEKYPVFAAGLQHFILPGLSVSANAGNSFRRPTLNDLFWVREAGQSLKNETGINAESGLQWNKQFKRALWQIAWVYYWRTLQNGILWMPEGAVWKPQNYYLGDYRGNQGLVKYSFSHSSHIFSAAGRFEYVHSSVQYQNENAQRFQRIFIPSVNGSMQLNWQYRHLALGTQIVHTGKRFVTTDNTDFLPSFTLLSASATFKNMHTGKFNFHCTVTAENLGNVTYVNMPGRPMPGRSVSITLQILYK